MLLPPKWFHPPSPKLVPRKCVSLTWFRKKLFHQHIFKNYFSQIQFIFPGACDDLAEERKNWEMALVKARTAHTNMGKLQLSVQEAVGYPPKNTTHQQVIGKLKQYDTTLQTKVQDYLQIVTQHTIPNLGEPTTTDHLRKKLVQDFGGYFCCNVIAV